ncbi:MAG TPA: hypothetical protein PLX89_05320 [Verrucomicrobiota bacterium]|nr:hypothetical protein [Verrucomicrobiota bacterium]
MNIRTKMTLLAGLASVGPALALPITSVTFGPWTSVGSFETAFLDLTGPAGVADFSVTFSASGTFRAADGTPNNTLETYTLKYGLVSVSLSSASGILIPDPVVVNFVDVGVVVNYLTPATGTPAEWPDIPYSIGPLTQTIQVPFSGAGFPGVEGFTIDWTTLSAFSAAGGKGVASFTENPVISGELSISSSVPESRGSAIVGGLSLLALAGLRRRKA